MQKNGLIEKTLQERKRKAVIAMKSAWSIGERIFKEEYKRRMKMFTALVGSVALFGAEIWGWHKDERLDAIGNENYHHGSSGASENVRLEPPY